MSLPEVVTREQWLAARRALLAGEKAHTRQADALAYQRRTLPMVQIDTSYVFSGCDGVRTLPELFEGRRQLIVYHFMFHPDWNEGCPDCTAGRNAELGPRLLEQLRSRDTTYVLVSRAPLEKLLRWRAKNGWDIPWYSTDDGAFSYDFGATVDDGRGLPTFNFEELPHDWHDGQPFDMPGRSCFLRDRTTVFHTYSQYVRAIECTHTAYNLLDLTALGRQEVWEQPSGRASRTRSADPSFSRC